MGPNIFRFPFIENRPRVLGATSFISLVFHGLLLGAIGLAIPLKSVKPPEDAGISIDLATIATPAPPAAPPADLAPTPPEPEPAKAEAPKPEPMPMPKKAPKPKPIKKAEAPKPAPQKAAPPKKGAVANSQGSTPSAPPKSQPPAQVASKAPIGETSAPAPAGGSSTPRPPYPELARKRGQEGTVNVRCQVDANGQVTNVSLAKSSGFKLLDEAALKAVGKWKFKPGKKNGASVAGTVVVPVQFKLQ